MTTLPLPNLDDRRWADLVEEARALIPFYAPDWTDHNVHDPGITVLELFAWIAEQDLYGLNRITDAHRRKFLALAGITLAPPRPAVTIVGLRLASGAAPTPVPAGLELTGHDPFGTAVRFRTRDEVTVQPGRLAAVLSRTDGGATPRDLTTAWERGEPIQPFGADPAPGAVLYLGFDVPAPWPDSTVLSLGLAVGDDRSGAAERAAIAAELAGAADDCVPPWSVSACPVPVEVVDASRPAHHDARLRWEVHVGRGVWAALEPDDVDDDTRSLTLDGRVTLRVPAPAPPSPLGMRPGALTWLRVRLVGGAFDDAPVLRGLTDNAVEVEQAVPATVRLQLAANAQVTGAAPAPGQLTTLDLALDRAGQVLLLGFRPATDDRPPVRLLAYEPGRSLTLEAAAQRGSGGPDQRVVIPDAPLVAESVRVFSLEDGTWRSWTARRDFDASTRADAHVVAEPTSGEVRFGDGDHGRAVPAAATVLVMADLTRGAAGNLARGAVDEISGSPHNLALVGDVDALRMRIADIGNIVPATGGGDAETLAAATARAREGREQATRAVTLDDYGVLARQTPGVRLARAEARANLHPGFGCQRAPGVVTVLILPFLPADRPVPSRGLRRAVAAYLDRRRVIGTRIEVTGPQYVGVTVRASVEALPGTRAGDLAVAVRAALDRFLHPLVGGPDGGGWPFGRDVYRSEVLTVIDEVPGVAHVVALELVAADGTVSCANLCVGPLGLVDAGVHEIDVR